MKETRILINRNSRKGIPDETYTKETCVLMNPNTGQGVNAEVLVKETFRIIVRPEGTKYKILLQRGDEHIPYRGRFKGISWTVKI
jgi:hypothetical protein